MESYPIHLIKYELDISRYLYVSSVINLGFIIEFDEVLLKLQQIIQYMYCISGYFLKKRGGGLLSCMPTYTFEVVFRLSERLKKLWLKVKIRFRLTPANRSEEIIQCVHIVKLLFLIHVHMIKRIFFGKETISHGLG